MKNKEKYESEADAFFAFNDECYYKYKGDCLSCPYRGVVGEDKFCMVRWLYSEAETDVEAESNDENNNISDTTKKSLSELCRIYCDITKDSGDLKEKLNHKILKIIQLYDSEAYFIEDYYTIDQHDLLNIEYLTLHKGLVKDRCKNIPIKWLDFEKPEIIKIIKSQEGKIDNG